MAEPTASRRSPFADPTTAGLLTAATAASIGVAAALYAHLRKR